MWNIYLSNIRTKSIYKIYHFKHQARGDYSIKPNLGRHIVVGQIIDLL